MDDIKIVMSLRNAGLLIKGVGEIIQNEAKEQKVGFFSMLLGTLGATIKCNMDKKYSQNIKCELRFL